MTSTTEIVVAEIVEPLTVIAGNDDWVVKLPYWEDGKHQEDAVKYGKGWEYANKRWCYRRTDPTFSERYEATLDSNGKIDFEELEELAPSNDIEYINVEDPTSVVPDHANLVEINHYFKTLRDSQKDTLLRTFLTWFPSDVADWATLYSTPERYFIWEENVVRRMNGYVKLVNFTGLNGDIYIVYSNQRKIDFFQKSLTGFITMLKGKKNFTNIFT